ncbi:YunC family protein [Marinicrinis sediminis]|uniref:YunC family protein n=1 Tax=Marinicrinis sediminis TaxID=1652465 RepID=A0ABW5R9H8_9BACL
MIQLIPIPMKNGTALGTEVKLPKTTLLTVSTEKGYIMCGALDVALLNEKLQDRNIVAGRAVGVRTIEQLMDAPLESVTVEAEKMGIVRGMSGREAIEKMF